MQSKKVMLENIVIMTLKLSQTLNDKNCHIIKNLPKIVTGLVFKVLCISHFIYFSIRCMNAFGLVGLPFKFGAHGPSQVGCIGVTLNKFWHIGIVQVSRKAPVCVHVT